MSVIVLSGIIRSGKSIEGVKIMIDNLMSNRHVYTNMDGWDDMKYLRGVIGLICEVTNEQEYDVLKRIHYLGPLDINHFYDFINHESALICIDEAHENMDSREWDDVNRKGMNTWIKKSGKGGHDMILITQDVDELDKRIKTLVAWTYVFQKVDYLGNMVVNSFSCDQYRGTNTKKKPFASFHRSYDSKLFPCFKSFAADHIVEIGAVKKPNILNHWSIKVAVLALFVMGYFVFYKSSLFSGDLFGAKRMTTGNQARIAALTKPLPIKKLSEIADRHVSAVPVAYTKPVTEQNHPGLNTTKVELPAKETEPVVCVKVGDIEMNDIHTVINDCGTYTEKIVNGVSSIFGATDKPDKSVVISKVYGERFLK